MPSTPRVAQQRRLARYYIQYQDPAKWTQERQDNHIEDTLTEKDALSLPQARRMAAGHAARLNTHVGIYERLDIEQIDPPYGPWVSGDFRLVEDYPR